MKALLLVAHGSRRKQSNEEVVILAEKLKSQCSAQYTIIHAAFLELSAPLIPDGIKLCVDDGATSIIVLPYFLNSGRHVIEDIPNIINETRALYPDIEINVAPHIGASPLIMDLLIASANTTVTNMA
ncbi:sirohydrochlorin chelatase [Colwellia sp. 20A7]|uniref:sirohydrochlorin chelatase n=1 Tax=Colwellia sp. 20A7 TaxID=2689569 RepID=UPI001357EC79|nr:CbiX/SirB N-terminal domain-containing protein [Colwellia sp. 20A7]